MPRKQVTLIDEHKRFIDDSPLRLSALVRDGIEEVMDGEREPPERQRRDTFNHNLNRTSVVIDDDHAAFVRDRDFVFTIFVHDLIDERIEYERKLDQMGE